MAGPVKRDPAEILAILTARAVRWEPSTHIAVSAAGHLRGLEWAGLAAHLSAPAWALLIYMYIDDASGFAPLCAELARAARRDLESDGVKFPADKKLADALIELAAWETLNAPPCRCCQGEGYVWEGPKLLTCERCGGAGRRLLGSHRAQMVRMSRQRWSKTWAWRYGRILGYVTGLVGTWDSEIKRQLRRELSPSPPSPTEAA